MVLLLAVWWAWVYTTWATNWLNPDSTACRLMLIGVMGVGLVMATSIPDAFGGGLTFAVAYAAIQVGRSSFVLWAVRADVTAVGDELVIAHPIGQADVATLATVLGGPALFLAGHALFRYTVIGVRSGSRLVAIALLVGLIPVAIGLSPLVIGLAATLVVAGRQSTNRSSIRRPPRRASPSKEPDTSSVANGAG